MHQKLFYTKIGIYCYKGQTWDIYLWINSGPIEDKHDDIKMNMFN